MSLQGCFIIGMSVFLHLIVSILTTFVVTGDKGKCVERVTSGFILVFLIWVSFIFSTTVGVLFLITEYNQTRKRSVIRSSTSDFQSEIPPIVV